MAKKVKLNDKVNKKLDKYVSEEGKELKRFIIILFSIIVLVLIVYGITRFVKKDEQVKDEVTAGVIDYDKVSIGTMLNRNSQEYYVILYDGKNENAVLYSAIINKYIAKNDSKKIYYCDLDNKLNSAYKAKDAVSVNKDAKSIDELALGDLTLIKVKNGKIDKYIENVDTIKKELGL